MVLLCIFLSCIRLVRYDLNRKEGKKFYCSGRKKKKGFFTPINTWEMKYKFLKEFLTYPQL